MATTTSTDTTVTTRARARIALLAITLGATLAVAPAPGVAAAGPPSPVALAPPPCSLVQPCRLSTSLPPSFSPQRPVLTPDGDTVVFEHTEDGSTRELYSVPVRGGADPIRLDPPQAPPSGHVTLSPDGQRVLYLSERPQRQFALFSAPINGPASATVRLAPLISGTSLQISPDGRLVVFQSPTRRVRAVPVDGPESAGVVLTRTATSSFGISSNSRNLVYIADQPGEPHELFRVPLTLRPDPDQQPTRLSGPMVDGGGVHSFRLPVGDGPVIYHAAQESPNIHELYSVGFGGGNRTKLNVPLPPGWRVGIASDDPSGFQGGYGISRDGRRVVYEIRAISHTTIHRLFSVPATGPANVSRRIDVTSVNTLPAGFHITADNRRVVYTVADGNAGPDRAFSVPIDGPADARVPVSAGGEDGAFVQVSPNGRRVVSRMPILNEDALLSGPVDESFPSPNMIRLNGSERPTGSVAFDPLARRVAYVAQVGAAERDVYSSALESRSRFNLTATLTADSITSLVVSDQHTVYSAQVSDDGFQLYSSRLVPGSSG